MTKLYDYTALSSLLQCEAEFDYRHRQGLTRPTPEVSAHFGTVVHAGVRALFDGQPAEAVADAVSTAWGEFVASEKKAHLNLAYAQAVVEMYGEVHGLSVTSGAPNINETGGRALSAPFDLVLNERYLEWPERGLCGIVDRVVRSKQDGQLYVMDLKTTGLYLSSAWFEQWRHSLQAAIYLDLVEHEMRTGESGKGQTIGNGSVAGFWVDAIHVDRRGYPKRDDFMRVGPFPYSAALRAELRYTVDDLVLRAKQLQAESEISGWNTAKKNPRACFRFQSLCPYFTLCTLDPADRADAVQLALASGDYEVRRWEPKERA